MPSARFLPQCRARLNSGSSAWAYGPRSFRVGAERANELLARAYVTDPGPDRDNDGAPDWVVPRVVNGNVQVKFDPAIQTINATGGLDQGRPGCDANDSSQCTCSSNKACLELSRYQEVPFFMRQAMRDYGVADPSMRGLH